MNDPKNDEQSRSMIALSVSIKLVAGICHCLDSQPKTLNREGFPYAVLSISKAPEQRNLTALDVPIYLLEIFRCRFDVVSEFGPSLLFHSFL